MPPQQAERIPSEVMDLATTRNLGPLRMAVRGERSNLLVLSVVGVSFATLFAGALTVSVVVGYFLSRQSAALFVALLFGSGTLVLLRLTMRAVREMRGARRSSYYVFRDGLLVQQGGINTIIPWDAITAVWQAAYRRMVNGVPFTWYIYTLQYGNDRKLTFTWRTAAMQELGTMLVREVTNRRLPEALRSLEARQTLDFGVFSLSLGGLTYKKATLPWNDVRKVQVVKGTVLIDKAGKRLASWAHENVARIPNYAVFMTLVERMARTT
jgi:hypothetical protein